MDFGNPIDNAPCRLDRVDLINHGEELSRLRREVIHAVFPARAWQCRELYARKKVRQATHMYLASGTPTTTRTRRARTPRSRDLQASRRVW
eukprot:scaffold21499_cov33-Phaeocystis_antarctica.AAC.1